MRKLCRCGKVIAEDRAKLGLNTCLACGATDAHVERTLMEKRVAPAGNKQGLVYMGPANVAQQNLLDSMKDRAFIRGVLATTTVTGRFPRPPEMQEVKPRRKAIGIVYFSGLPNGEYIYSRFDPRIQRASRVAFFDEQDKP